MSARRKGSADSFGYTQRELKLAMRAMRGLQQGRVPVLTVEEWELAERGAAILDALEAKQARREARAAS